MLYAALLATAVVSPHHVMGCLCHAALLQTPPAESKPLSEWPANQARVSNPTETNLSNVKQLTFGGQNAEAYWNLDGSQLVFQTRQPQYADEQIYLMNADGTNRRRISTGMGRTTCSYVSPDGKYIYFSSTHEKNMGAQKPLDMSKGYVWMVNPDFSLYRTDIKGRNLTKVIDKGNYVAETTIAPDGSYMTFTGAWEGDVEIYRSDLDGGNIRKLTDTVGYDGGPFVSWDGKKIVYRRSAPFANQKEQQEYLDLLKENLVRPSRMDLYIMDADGKNNRQVTNLNGASFAPFLHPNGKQIIFSSNHHDPKGREFDLFVVNVDGTGLKQVTFTPDFDGFPMFSRDGKKLVWASNRFGVVRGETNIFTADWKP